MSTSIWQAQAPPVAFRSLQQDLRVDVAIVGGGMTGMLCATLLRREGVSVALLEARRVGLGTTGHSTGNLYALVGQYTHALADEAVAASVWQARASGIDLIESLIREHGIACDFARRPWVLFSETSADEPGFERIRRIAQRAGVPVRDGRDEPGFAVRGAVAVDGQAQFNPLAFVRGLAKALEGLVYEDTPVLGLEPGEETTALATARGRVHARWVILATHTPKGVLKVHTALAPHREYAVAAPLRGGAPPGGICWSTESPRHSLRGYVVDGKPHVVVAGGSHKTGQEPDPDAHLTALARHLGQRFDVGDVAYRWSAQGYYTPDLLPLIGTSALGDRVLYASGFGADGLTWAAVAAPILVSRLRGRRGVHDELFDPQRSPTVAAAASFVKDNANVLAQYLKDIPGHANADGLAQVQRGHGRTLEREGEKLAVYRDDEGVLHCVSAVCTHMQCIVNWNASERSWDYPCHGSRFTVDGEVLEGPAYAPLPVREVKP